MLALQMEVAQKALEAEQEKVPRQESLRKELAALEAELPRYQELSNQEAVLATLVESIESLEKTCSQQAEEQAAKEGLLGKWKQELDGLASVDAEQERLLRERDQAEGRQAVLAALKSQIEQWQVCLQKINTEQHQHEELIQKQKELAARLAEEKARLRANQETFQASAGLSEEKLELLHRQDQAQKRQQALADLLCELGKYNEEETSLPSEPSRTMRQARERSEQLEETYRRKNRAFLDEQAGLLAQSLVEGQPCPVCGSLHHPTPAGLSGDAPTEAELEEAKTAWEEAQQKTQDTSMAAGKQRASLKEQEKQLIRAMTDYIDSPVLSTAREQLVACQMYGAEELARLHQVLLEKEAQLIHREELEQEITRQADSLTELEEQAAEMKESIKRTEVSLGTLDGQRAQLEDNLHRELLAHLQACSLEDAPAAISRALSEVTEKIAQMARLEQEFGEKLQKKQELNRNIPLMEQEMRMLEENTGKLKEELAGAVVGRRNCPGSSRRCAVGCPSRIRMAHGKKSLRCRRNCRPLLPRWNRPKKRSQISKKLWLPLMLPSENRRIF